LLICARYYADLAIVPAILILLSPAVGWALVRFGTDEGFFSKAFVRFIAMLIPAAAAAVYAILTSAPSGY
jgi:hypothetical protein